MRVLYRGTAYTYRRSTQRKAGLYAKLTTPTGGAIWVPQATIQAQLDERTIPTAEQRLAAEHERARKRREESDLLPTPRHDWEIQRDKDRALREEIAALRERNVELERWCDELQDEIATLKGPTRG